MPVSLTDQLESRIARDSSCVVRPSPSPGQKPRWTSEDVFSYGGLAALILYATIRNVCYALVRPLWYDEICTVIVAQQNSVSRMWQAVKLGLDSHPLTFYLAERFTSSVIPNENLGYRAFPLLGFAITILCLFIVINTRRSGLVALVCAVIPTLTILSEVFCAEARGYSMVIACASFAIVCYQRAGSRLWTILLGVSFVAAESFHHFAVFAFFPFLLAESAHFLEHRQFRKGVWLALFSGYLPLAFYWPILSSVRKYYGEHMWWPKPTLEAALNSYSWYFLREDEPWGRYIAAVAALAVLITIFVTLRQRRKGISSFVPLPELVLTLGFVGLPFVGFAVAKLTHNGTIAKYYMASLLGFSLALGFSLPKLRRWNAILPAAAGILLLSAIVHRDWGFWSTYDPRFVPPTRYVEDLVDAGEPSDLPILVSYSLDFMQLQHYADKNWKKRFVMVIDPGQEVVYTGSDSAAKNMAVIRQFTDFPIYDFQNFTTQHPSFLVYSSLGGRDGDWWTSRLKHDGFKLRNFSVRPPEMRDFFHRVVLATSAEPKSP